MTRRIPFKRRRKKLTNYKKRLKLIKSGKPRFVVRISNMYVNCQIIKYQPDGDVTITAFNSKKLSNYGFKGGKNLQSAYLTGYVTGLKALKQGVKETVLDSGLRTSVKNSRIYACLKGLIEAGIKAPHSDEVLPNDKLLKKESLNKHVKKIKSDIK